MAEHFLQMSILHKATKLTSLSHMVLKATTEYVQVGSRIERVVFQFVCPFEQN